MASNRSALLSLLIISAIAAVLRLPGLDERSLWFDEGYSIALATEFPPKEIIVRTQRDFHPPLYFLLLRAWSQLAGKHVAGLRLLSVIFGILAVAGIAALPGRASDSQQDPEAQYRLRLAGLSGAALLAIAASHIRWSQEVRMYALGVALAVWSTVALSRIAIDTPSRRAWCLVYVTTAAALAYTHYFGAFTLLAHGLWAGGVALAAAVKRWKLQRPSAAALCPLLCVACAGALFLPWLRVLLAQRRRFQNEFWSGSDTSWSLPETLFEVFFPLNAAWTPDHTLVVAFMALLAITLVLCLFVRSREAVLIVLCAAVPVVGMAVLSSIGRSATSPRYLLFAFPFFLAAIGLAVSRWVPRRVHPAVIALLLIDAAFVATRYSHSVHARHDASVKGAAEYLRTAWQRREPIVVMHPCILSSLRVYLDERAHVRLYAPADKIPAYLGTAVLRDDDFAEASDLAPGTSVWVVDCTGYGHPPHHPIPESWVAVEKDARAFRGVYFFEHFVTVRRYRVPLYRSTASRIDCGPTLRGRPAATVRPQRRPHRTGMSGGEKRAVETGLRRLARLRR